MSSFISSKIINSYKVNRFDARAVYIVRQLFKAYYNNPRQMSDRALYTLVDDLQKIEHRYEPIEVNDKSGGKVNILSCSLRECTPKEVELVISFLHGEIDAASDFVEQWQRKAMKMLTPKT